MDSPVESQPRPERAVDRRGPPVRPPGPLTWKKTSVALRRGALLASRKKQGPKKGRGGGAREGRGGGAERGAKRGGGGVGGRTGSLVLPRDRDVFFFFRTRCRAGKWRVGRGERRRPSATAWIAVVRSQGSWPVFTKRFWCSSSAFLAYEAVTNAIENLRAARIASGFGFMGEAAGFDINQAFIEYSAAGSDLRRGLHRRPAQHPDRRRDRHRAGDHHRLHDGHRAAVEELAARQGRLGLRRDHPQPAAPAPAAVLVQRGAWRPCRPRGTRSGSAPASTSTCAGSRCRRRSMPRAPA